MVELGAPAGRRAGSPVWVAGGPAGRTEEARGRRRGAQPVGRRAGARGRAGAGPDGVEVTWAGPPPAATPPLAERLRALHEAGATWAVFGWPVDVEALAAAADAALSERPLVRAARDAGR